MYCTYVWYQGLTITYNIVLPPENGSPETGSPETGSPETGSLEDLDEAGNEIDLDGCYVATEDYLKQGVDELDLFEGQIVCVIDDSDNGELVCFLSIILH